MTEFLSKFSFKENDYSYLNLEEAVSHYEERLFSFSLFLSDSHIFFGYNCAHLKILLFLQLNYYNLSPLTTKMLTIWIQVKLSAKKLKLCEKIKQ